MIDEVKLPIHAREQEPFQLRLVARLKHGVLDDLAKRLGSHAALAKELGVNKRTVGAWINLRTMPTFCGDKIRCWSIEKSRSVVLKLCELTGKRIEDIFPGFVRDILKEIDTRVEIDRPLRYGEAVEMLARRDAQERRLTAPDPLVAAANEEMRDQIREALETLPYRQREIIKLRFGLDDGYAYSLDDVSRIFKVTRERVRQIESHAIRRLQSGSKMKRLSEDS